MPFRFDKSGIVGSLAAAITAIQTSIALRDGHGARFSSIGSGDQVGGTLIDRLETATFPNYEHVLISGPPSVDTISIERAFHGSTALAFPITGGNPATGVQLIISDIVPNLQAISDGAGAIIQSTAPTLTAFSPRNIILGPSGAISVALPTTNVWAGKTFRFINTGSATITITASGGTTVATLPAGFTVELVAFQDAPTTSAHWGVPASFFPDGKYIFAAGSGGATHKGMGILYTAAGATLLQSSDVTLAGSGGPTTGNLCSLSVPADTLGANGATLRMIQWGTKTNANAALSLQPHWGAGGALTTHTISAACTDWMMETYIVRTGVGGQDWCSVLYANRDDTGSTTLVDSGTATEDETGALTFKGYCSSKHTNDVVVGSALIPFYAG